MSTELNINASLDGETVTTEEPKVIPNPIVDSPAAAFAEKAEDEEEEVKPVASKKKDDDIYEEIKSKMNDETTPLVDICRLINRQLLEVGMRVRDQKAANTVAWQQKQVEQELKVLTALQKGVSDSDMLAKRDTLNFDGPKFQFVFDELLSYFEQAVKDAMGKSGEAMSQSIIKHFRDIIAMKEAHLRRETAKIGTQAEK
jgi:hypothetical protein